MNSLRRIWKVQLLKAEISLSYKNVEEADAVAKAVSPDNVVVPKGLFIRTLRRRNKVFTKIECKTRLQTFISTIDDLLNAISIAEKSLSAIKNQ